MSHDVIVIGAGVNGLVAAHLLARTGQRVLVLERQADAARGHDVGWVPPQVASELGLAAHGLRIEHPDPWLIVALPDGGSLTLSQDRGASSYAIAALNAADAGRWPEFCHRMRSLGGVLEMLYVQPAPDVETRELGELVRLGRLGLNVRRRGRQTIIDLLRVLPMSVAELLDEWFQHPALKAALGAAGVMHLRQGPRSGGTAFSLLHHHVGAAPGVFRPPLSNLGAVLAGLGGIDVRREATVTRITVKNGAVIGVVLANGDEIPAHTVVSNADPRATLLGLLEPGRLDPEFVRAVRNIKCRGVAARVTVKLERPAAPGTHLIADSLDHLERAYDDAKYGRVSANPWIELHADGPTATAHVQCVPYALAEGSWDEARRRALGATVLARIQERLPALRASAAGEVLTPADLEARTGLTEGQAYHGELTLDQVLFMRPVAGWSRYRTPILGLYLCGAGTHPGGAIAGGPGRLAARAILEDVDP